ncbi:MAG: single-stranded-DNA-specific exonuclease RecJ [Bacillota bacterium]
MTVKIEYQENIELPQWLLEKVDNHRLLAKLLFQRGVDTPQEVEQFLNPDDYQGTKAAEFPGMGKAVELIIKAVADGQKICVYGDYDADGVTSTAILVTMLRALDADVSYHIPNRFTEGYGMDSGVVQSLAADGIDLIITCDCGISNHEEVKLAKELGMDVIVTDHHDLPEQLPEDADVILSPKLLAAEHKAYHLPGAGMAYFLAQAVLRKEDQAKLAAKLIDFAALAIVADVVRLRGENRYLLQQGLKSLAATSWPGIAELCRVAKIELFQISEVDIGFRIGPRLNAAGRIDKADKAVELLLAREEQRAKMLAEKLNQINQQRKKIGSQMKEEALAVAKDKPDGSAIVLYQPDWHQGIVGIAAGRLADKFNVPVLLLCDKENSEEIITGSARSIEGIHIRDALAQCSDLLLSFGGHAGAAGCSLNKNDWPAFQKQLTEILNQELKDLGAEEKITVDHKLELKQTDFELYEDLQKIAPFGEGNPEPLFYDNDLEVVNYRTLNTEHNLKLTVSDGQQQRTAIWWQGDEEKLANKIDIVYTLAINTWQGQRNLQLEIKDVIKETEELTTERKLDCDIVDWRDWKQRGRPFPEFDEALYYYEGAPKDWTVEVIDRYSASQAEQLVLLSCPPNSKILKDLLYTTAPQKLILAYTEQDLQLSKQFIKRLIGFSKHILENKKGITDIYTLAALTAERELTVSLGLKYLQAQGYIRVQFVGADKILLARDSSQSNLNPKQDLQRLLGESRAFREYMLNNPLQQISELTNLKE